MSSSSSDNNETYEDLTPSMLMDPDLWSFSSIKLNQADPDQKASDMSKPGYPSAKAKIEYLEEKPKAEDKECRNGNDPDKEKKKDQSQNPCSWVKNQIGPKNSRYGSTGSDHRNLRVGVKDDMG